MQNVTCYSFTTKTTSTGDFCSRFCKYCKYVQLPNVCVRNVHIVIAEAEDDKRLSEWKDDMENRGMRVNMIKTKVMINEEC